MYGIESGEIIINWIDQLENWENEYMVLMLIFHVQLLA